MGAFIPGVENGGIVLTGPATDGAAGQVLATDGAGSLEFVDAAGGAVSSVNGHTGTVELDANDVGAATASHAHPQSDVTGLVSALAAKAAATDLTSHTGNTSNPHGVTKSQVGLGNVTNDAQLKTASNLSDLGSAATARTNLGVPQAPATNGAAEAGKALVPDSNIDITAGLRNVILTGSVRTATGSFGTPSVQIGSASAGWYAISPPGGGGGMGGRIGNQRNVSFRPTHVGGSVGIFIGQSAFGDGGLAFDTSHAEATLSANASGLTLDANNTLRVSNGSSGYGHLAAATVRHQSFTVAALPSAGTAGRFAFASNGRKSGEGSGAGTGVPVWDDGTNWRTFYDNSIVTA